MAQATTMPLVRDKPLKTSKYGERKQQEQLPTSRPLFTRLCYNCGDHGHILRCCPKPRAQGAAQGNARDLSLSRGGRYGGQGRSNQRYGCRGRGQKRNQATENSNSAATVSPSAFSSDDARSLGSSMSGRLTYVGGGNTSVG
ncbi:unnamed protein product, partial [Sphacelaria rigidula]